MTDQNNLDTTFSERRARLEDLKDPELQRLGTPGSRKVKPKAGKAVKRKAGKK